MRKKSLIYKTQVKPALIPFSLLRFAAIQKSSAIPSEVRSKGDRLSPRGDNLGAFKGQHSHIY